MLWRVFFVATLVGFYGLYSGHLSEDISSVAIICGSAVGLYLLIIRPLGRLFFGGKKSKKISLILIPLSRQKTLRIKL